MLLDEQDALYLRGALELAEGGIGCTSPNPLVGAVIVASGSIVGEGYHSGPGRDHAEIVAMKEALGAQAGGCEESDFSEHFGGATLYVTLEPCCHFGRTPPCTSALVSGGFARVVVGSVDPSPHVNGRGLEQLRAAGIQVDLADGELARLCRRQNDGFRKAVSTGLPFVVYKYAMTLDGRIATDSGDSRWISGPESRALVHEMRSTVDAVMIGGGTLRADDPRLTAREVACRRQPLRVVLDFDLSLRRDMALVQTALEGPVLAVCGPGVEAERRREVEAWGVATECADLADPPAVARMLASRGIQTVLLEGGPTVAGAWWSAGLIDRVVAFVAPRIVSGGIDRAPLTGCRSDSMEEATGLTEVEARAVGDDVMISGYLRGPF